MSNFKKPITITVDGVTRTLGEWGEFSGINPHTIYQRIQRGVSPRIAVSAPRSQSYRELKGTRSGNAGTIDRMANGGIEPCECSECQRERSKSRPRTHEERSARWRKELAAKQLAKAEGRW